ncbi:MAG: DUF1553 domain-containing protein [Planctomycetia bacterium]|nr:DUF1553 domain-containing protein [Planctomycetia bacterium]
MNLLPARHVIGSIRSFLRAPAAAVWLTVVFAQAAGGLFAQQPEYTEAERSYWAFQKPVKAPPPALNTADDRRWARNPVDAFILAELRRNGLQPAPEADGETLVRRLYYDLTGLPPSPEAVEAFCRDSSQGAFERLVDELLASPHYGEKWGQHWLDVARFAESEGFEYDRHLPDAWRYRDYVVSSFNADKPYDRFVTEQLAGDELAESLADETAQREALVAAGFHRLGAVRRNAGNQDVAFSRHEVLTEMADAVGSVFLGLTVGCARCHDHMFDPIKQQDYYQLQAYLAAAHEHSVPLAAAEVLAKWKAENDAVMAELTKLRAALEAAGGAERERLAQEIKQVETRLPKPLDGIMTVANKPEVRTEIHVLQRGDPAKPLQTVAMGPPGVLLASGTSPLAEDTPHPRTKLAQWIVSPDNPLAARVIANRVWQHHFGQGLVSTPNDFGANGSQPSHGELLDYLAVELVESGWRLKHLHRLILTSSTWRQSSRAEPAAQRISESRDPENRLLWRFSRRRLTAEETRDTLLAVSGRLHVEIGGPSIMTPVEPDLVNLLYKPSQWEVHPDRRQHDRRSIYLIAKRNLRLPFMEAFDQPALLTSCPHRAASTHAPQALEMLNGTLANDLAECFAARLLREAGDDADRRIDLAFRLATGRAPTDEQRSLSREFLRTQPLREFCLAVFSLNDVMYVD